MTFWFLFAFLDQLDNIKKVPFSQVLCKNTHLKEIQKYAFRFPSSQ